MTMFTRPELDAFEEYTALLLVLCDQEYGGFDSRTMLAHQCPACARRVLAGIPFQLKRGDYDLCPACVRIKRMIGPLRARLGKAAADIGKPLTETDSFKNAKTTSAAPKAARTDRMERLIVTLRERAEHGKPREAAEARRQINIIERALERTRSGM